MDKPEVVGVVPGNALIGGAVIIAAGAIVIWAGAALSLAYLIVCGASWVSSWIH